MRIAFNGVEMAWAAVQGTSGIFIMEAFRTVDV